MNNRRNLCPLQSEEHAALLLDYCARRLDAGRGAALEAHMEQCPACREMRDAQRLVWDSLDAWDAGHTGWEFNQRLQERLRHECRPAWIDTVASWKEGISWKPAVPLAAALALWLIVFPPNGANAPQPQSAQQTEQIEKVLEDVEMLQQIPLSPR